MVKPCHCRRLSLIVLLMLLTSVARAERFFNVWEASYGLGTPGPTSSWLTYLSDMGPGMALHNAKLTLGHQYDDSDWGVARQGFHYPVMGLSFSLLEYSHCHLSGNGIYTGQRYDWGRFLALSWHHSQYYLASDRFRLRTVWDLGFAYNFNHHDSTLPHLLMPMGGHLQVYLEMGLMASWQTDGCEWSLGPHFIHCSNSNTNEPNSGINNLGVTVSLRQGTHVQPKVSPSGISPTTFHPRFYTDIMASLGVTRVEQYPQNLYGQPSLWASMMWQYNPHSAIGLGLDASYLPRGDRDGQRLHSGLSFVHTTWMQHWSIHGQVGTYLGHRHPVMWKGYSRIYERLGLRYHFMQQRTDARSKVSPYVGFGVKGDGFVAQELEASVGICVF